MNQAFGPRADFGPMRAGGKRGCFISEVRHKTYVSVDEVGTEAAAVTSVSNSIGFVIDPYQLIADKPFFYAICDDTTGAILFMGIVNDPRSS
jgi:serpin B